MGDLNRYITEKLKLPGIENEILEVRSLIDTLKIQLTILRDKIYVINSTCTHLDEEGNSTWEYIGQDPGSGRSEHRCSLCGKI